MACSRCESEKHNTPGVQCVLRKLFEAFRQGTGFHFNGFNFYGLSEDNYSIDEIIDKTGYTELKVLLEKLEANAE